MGTKLSVSEISQETGDSERQVHRYIRLTNLVPELLEFVDEGRIKMRPAVELSYLDEDCQRDIVDEIDMNEVTPSHDQAIRMRKFFDEGKLTTEVIQAIMSEEKPNQREKLVFRGDRVRKLIPKSIPLSETEDYVCKGFGVCQEKCVSFFVSFFTNVNRECDQSCVSNIRQVLTRESRMVSPNLCPRPLSRYDHGADFMPAFLRV